MIKAVIFDLDNTLYSYDANHIYGMEALAGYCRETFGITEEETREYYRKAGYIMANRIGTDTAAIHSRMLRLQCMMELLEKPLCPHVQKMYHIYCISSAYRTKSGSPGFPYGTQKKKDTHRNRYRYDSLYPVQKTRSNRCGGLY